LRLVEIGLKACFEDVERRCEGRGSHTPNPRNSQ